MSLRSVAAFAELTAGKQGRSGLVGCDSSQSQGQSGRTPTLHRSSLEGRAAVPWDTEAGGPRGARGGYQDDSAPDPANLTQGAEASEQAPPKAHGTGRDPQDVRTVGPGRLTERKKQGFWKRTALTSLMRSVHNVWETEAPGCRVSL